MKLFAQTTVLAAGAALASTSVHATSLQNSLFPTSHTYSSGFTTASNVSVPGVASVPLSDSSLNVNKVASGLTHNVVQQSGKTAWAAFYPKGSWSPTNTPKGGLGFYVNGTNDFSKAAAAGAKQVIFGYSVMFQQGWQWNIGGKLPGGCKSSSMHALLFSDRIIDGGAGSLAYECSGGRQDAREECFDLRLMWR